MDSGGQEQMIAVLDISGVMEIIMKTNKGSRFHEALKKTTKVIAPDLYVSELTNTIWKYYKAKLLTEDSCVIKAEEGLKFIDEFINSKELWEEALGEGIRNNHPIYDMYYAVLARRNNGTLITSDGDLAKICKNLKIDYVF
jgi:predicted nucleic acid-binding protein